MKSCHHGTYENARCLNCEIEKDKLRIAALEAALNAAARYIHDDKSGEPSQWAAFDEIMDLIRTALASTAETKGELCPHGFVLAEMVCGPCSEGRPNKHEG